MYVFLVGEWWFTRYEYWINHKGGKLMLKIQGKMMPVILTILVLAFTVHTIVPYVSLDPSQSRVNINPAYSWQYPLLIVHIFSSAIAMAIGPFQFSTSLRIKKVQLHRALGKIYLICILIGGITGFGVALYIEHFTREIALAFLALIWLFTAWKAYHTIRNKLVQEHRAWMIRNYALILVVPISQLVGILLMFLYSFMRGVTLDVVASSSILPTIIAPTGVWLVIVLHLIIAEWSIIPPKKKQKRISGEMKKRENRVGG